MQEHYMQLIQAMYSEKNIMLLYLSPYEIKGLERIAETAKKLFQ